MAFYSAYRKAKRQRVCQVLQVFCFLNPAPKNAKKTVNRSSRPKSRVFLHNCHNFCLFNTTLHIGSIDEIRTHRHRGLQVIHLMGPPSRYKNQIICFQLDFMNGQLSQLPSLAILDSGHTSTADAAKTNHLGLPNAIACDQNT